MTLYYECLSVVNKPIICSQKVIGALKTKLIEKLFSKFPKLHQHII